ncbi:hypothetical protein [Atlantibacter hermannii]|uniref:hypothetical protein n=1 Tax=Atlantibacter hermannii TaxID=565 RepID=UPI002FDDFD3D
MFRADESAQSGFERACRYLTPEGASPKERVRVREKIEEIITECGPVTDGYPAWHPFLMESDPATFSTGKPNSCPSFKMLDHTVYLTNGIITCPYSHGVKELFNAIEAIHYKHDFVSITIEEIEDVTLYHPQATPILIRCNWAGGLEKDGTIPLRTALGLMLERELPGWRWADYNQSWESMRDQILGYPHGARSSLFVNQQTGQQMKSVWNQLVKSGLWGNKTKN